MMFKKLLEALGDVDRHAWDQGWIDDREVAELIASYLDIRIPERMPNEDDAISLKRHDFIQLTQSR